MKIHLLEAVHGNFGDELNRWLWQAVLPGMWDEDGDTLFVGIGTILDRKLPDARTVLVFGTGAGYTAPPTDIATNAVRWRIYGVRGPLTARALALEPRLALTDPAILLATLEEFRGLPRRGVIFVPHWKSVRYGCWQRICASLGIEFVDPCSDSKAVVQRIASAEKVIAESMHAAIIADAFRVPWIPVALSREISPFKWTDWAASLDMSYRPVCLPASNRIESLRNTLLQWSVHANTMDYPAPAAVAQGYRMQFDGMDALMADFETIGSRINQAWRWNASIGLEVMMKRLARLGLKAAPRVGLGHSERLLETATEHLARVKASAGSLSADGAHARALERALNRLGDFARDWRHGTFATASQLR
jgi:succinoglycan biosynthesis protein ExoV